MRDTPNRQNNADRRLLLVVQGNTLARTALVRFFAPIVEVASFAAPIPAENYLRKGSRPIYLLIGQLFSGDKPGSQWIQRWRRRYPQIRRAVLATGLDDVPEALDGVDAIVGKPFDVRLVTKLLTLDKPATWAPASTHQQRIPI